MKGIKIDKDLQSYFDEPIVIQTRSHAERANIVFGLVFGVKILEEYVEEDSDASCILALNFWVLTLYREPNINPIKKKLKNEAEFMAWFNLAYPLA